MKIRTKLRIGYVLSTSIVIAAGVMIFLSLQQIRDKGLQLKFSDAITQDIF